MFLHSHDALLQVGARFIGEESVSVRYHTLSDSPVFKFEESKSSAATANLKNHKSNVFSLKFERVMSGFCGAAQRHKRRA